MARVCRGDYGSITACTKGIYAEQEDVGPVRGQIGVSRGVKLRRKPAGETLQGLFRRPQAQECRRLSAGPPLGIGEDIERRTRPCSPTFLAMNLFGQGSPRRSD